MINTYIKKMTIFNKNHICYKKQSLKIKVKCIIEIKIMKTD